MQPDNQNPQAVPIQPATPAQPGQPQPQAVYLARPLEPGKVQISAEVMERHEAAKKKFPNLNLSNGEYVISAAKRHPIGLFQIWAFVAIVVAILVAAIVFFATDPGGASTSLNGETAGNFSVIVAVPLLLLSGLCVVGGMVGTYVYNANTFYLTNESVIQNIQSSLFSKREQTVSLGSIEDASFSQEGILSHMLNFGSIRLSTVGDETTYRFNYTSQPKNELQLLNNAVEAFKNGRPVEG
ncbi:MAG: hypothetical protein JWN38_864 [Candidatus Saccharibacteria bacterium]|nr:hypothetical protein [Candidatus Saccharibacteria bacterium]